MRLLRSKKPRFVTPGYLYFVQVAGLGPVKIGWSTNPHSRFITLASANHCELVMLGTVPGTSADEKFIQNKFIEQVRRNEWFEPSAELMQFIVDIIESGEVPTDCRGDQHTPSLCRALTDARARANRASQEAA